MFCVSPFPFGIYYSFKFISKLYQNKHNLLFLCIFTKIITNPITLMSYATYCILYIHVQEMYEDGYYNIIMWNF